MTAAVLQVDQRQLVTQRTLKYMQAVALGCWVVSLQWVLDSAAAGQWLPEGSFEVAGDTTATGAPRTGTVGPSNA